jgi:hypothetical protein
MLNHLKQMHDLYTYGQDQDNRNVSLDPETGLVETAPAYPEHAEKVEQISELVIMLQGVIKQFKQEHV